MAETTVLCEVKDGVAELTLNRPERMNAFTPQMAAELIQAFRRLPEDAEVTVHSDSQLCVKTINEWAPGWKKRGWKRKTGPIKNLDLVKRLYALAQAKKGISLVWIKAHDGSKWNEYADALASSYRR